MLMICEWLSVAQARPPDFVFEGHTEYDSISGHQGSGEPDKLFWRENETNRLYVTELFEGQLVHTLLAENIAYIVGLLDYDGDGRRNLVVSRGSEDYIDAETGVSLEFSVSDDCSRIPVGDIDGDGFEDLIYPSTVERSEAEGFVIGASLYTVEGSPYCPGTNPLGDIDGDGRSDFARETITNPTYYYNMRDGTLDLYLGCGYNEPAWTPHWRYNHPIHAPSVALAADVDGDGAQELVGLSSVSYDGTFKGEVFILDDILDPLGPSLLISKALGSEYLPVGLSLHSVGDIDADGDDEILLQDSEFGDGYYMRVIDAESTQEGLFAVVGPSFDLVLPEGFPEDDARFELLRTHTGDYNGDGFLDVAAMVGLSRYYGSEEIFGGNIAIWLTTPPEGAVPPTSLPAPEDMSYCEPPPVQETADTGDPEAPPKATSCAGCATTTSPSGLLLLFALPWLTRRRE